ncbi:MAG: hypothetical protein ND895_24230 [Pyrinomonadaceae bacterium]|nr:hypothetical protein [Pyrinomonadaceae bacterium]
MFWLSANNHILTAAVFLWISIATFSLPSPQLYEDQGIAEALLKYEMHRLAASPRWKVFYIAFGLTDPYAPDEMFMSRFGESVLPVRKYQKKEFDVERLKKEGGVVLGVYGIKHKSDAEVEVEWYRFVVPGEAEGYVCTVNRKYHQWVVGSCKGTWIS